MDPLTDEPPSSNEFKEDDFSVSGLYYSEEDRVLVQKIQNKITKQINEDNIVRVDLIYDTMSGSSPNGKIFSDKTQSGIVSISTASGFNFDAVNTTGAASNKSWLQSFVDTRKAANLEWEYKPFRTLTSTLGIGSSSENDYDSYSASGNLVFEFNQKLSTLNIGAALSSDKVSPIGGVPEGLGIRTCTKDLNFHPVWLVGCEFEAEKFKPANKFVTDYIIGMTQVWNRRTILQFNYARSNENGYLTDPYKLISVVKATYGESAILNEKRPRTRNTNSIYFKVVNVPKNNIALNLSYRYFWDDWDIDSHTLDARLRYNFNSRVFLQGHGRLHYQSAAFFFEKQISVDADSPNFYAEKPNFISADSRLSELISATAGVKLGVKISERFNITARLERMQQHYYSAVLPRLKVWIAQLVVHYKF